MESEGEYTYAMRAALDAVGTGQRPAWRHLSKILGREPVFKKVPQDLHGQKREPVNADISLGRVRFGSPAAHSLGRIKWVS